jgi:RNA polymerase sigma-70 factor (ECF subfamily)
VVALAGDSQSPEGAAALERLCRAYWTPLYAFIWHRGYSEADAQDLTQEFFARLIERKEFDGLSPRKGKFRTFLLTALTHFLSNERDRERAVKRGGGRHLISLDELQAEQRRHLEPADSISPDKLFDARWALTVLERALAVLRQEMTCQGKERQFEELRDFLSAEAQDGEYGVAAERLGATLELVAVMVHRLRRRYRELVRAEVAQTVIGPLELEEEMRHLFAALAG